MAVRRESVEISVHDELGSALIKDAAAARLLAAELDRLSGKTTKSSQSNKQFQRDVDNLTRSTDNGGKSIDKYSGRLGLLAEAAITIGPALIPIGAAAVPAITALTAGLGAAAGAFGVTLLAVKGLGDGLKALDAYQLDPTVENLAKLREEFDKLGPAGTEFVRFLDGLEPKLKALQETAREGLFPGVEQGIDSLLTRLPQVKTTVSNIAEALGSISADAGKNLAGPKFNSFFNYVKNDAGPILRDFAEIAGNVGEALANLLVAFDPLSTSFTGGLLKMSQAFAQWSRGLDQNQGFQNFVAYVQKSGPQVIDLIGALVSALASIVEAAAPLGSVVLPVLTEFLRVIGAIAGSDIGTPILVAAAAFVSLNRALTLVTGTISVGSKALFATNPYVAGALVTVASIESIIHANDGLNASIESAQAALDSGDTSRYRAQLKLLQDQIDKSNYDNSPTSFLDHPEKLLGGVGTAKAVFSIVDKLVHHTGDEADETRVKLQNALNFQKYFSAPKGSSYVPLLTGPLDANAASFKRASLAARDYETSIKAALGLLDRRGAWDAFQSSVLAVDQALKDNGKTLDKNTAKGIANRETLNTIASTAQTMAEKLHGVDRVNFLEKARNAFVDASVKLGDTRKHAGDLATSLGLLDKQDPKPKVNLDDKTFNNKLTGIFKGMESADKARANPKVTVDDHQAISAVQAVKSLMDQLHDRNIHINVTKSTNATLAEAAANSNADGGFITGPGGPRDDRIPAMLSNGEFVVNAAATAKNLDLLHRMNAQKFADGGVVKNTHARRPPKPVDVSVPTWVSDQWGYLFDDITLHSKKAALALERELKQRQSLLDHEVKHDQHVLDQDKKETDAVRSKLQAYKQERQAIIDSVASRVAQSPFSAQTPDSFLPGISTPVDPTDASAVADAKLRMDLMAKLRAKGLPAGLLLELKNASTAQLQVLVNYDPTQLAAFEGRYEANVNAATPLGSAQGMLQRAKEYLRVIRLLQSEGLTGAALQDAVANATLEQLQALAAGGSSIVGAYTVTFNQTAKIGQQAGVLVGNDATSAQIARQSVLLEQALAAQRSAAADLKDAKTHLSEIARAEKQVEHAVTELNKTGPKRTGDAVGDKLNHAGANAQRRK